jgi:DNA repair exonuclease SbcCD ATPase subunit
MQELSPLPADIKKEYYKDGYKEIHITHNNSNYVLLSGKSSPTKHNFIKDNVELNPGGTKKVQLELCQQHFNITPNIHNVLIGRKNLTEMSVGERKQWLSDISTIDYQYPLSVYKKLQTRLRDVIGSIKFIDGKLSTLEESIITDDEYNKLLKEKQTFNDLLYMLYNNIEKLTGSNNYTTKDLDKINNDLSKHIKRLNRLLKNSNNEDINIIKYKLNDTTEEIKNTLKLLEDTELASDNTINEELTNLEKELSKYEYTDSDLSKVYLYDIFSNNYIRILESINTVCNLNPQTDTSQTHIEALYKKLNNLLQEIENTLKTSNKTKMALDRLESIKNKEKVQCPNCSTSFLPGYSDELYNKLKSDMENLNIHLNKLEDAKNKISTELEDIERFNKSKSDLLGYLEYLGIYPLLEDTLIKSDDLIDVDKLTSNLERFKEWFSGLYRYSLLKEKYNKLLKEKEFKDNLIKIQNDVGVKSKEEIEEYLDKLYKKQQELKDILNTLEEKNKTIKTIEDLYKQISVIKKSLKNDLDNNVKELKNKYLNEYIEYVKNEIDHKDNLIKNSEYIKRSIETLKENKKEQLERKKVLEILTDTLSPTEGLIAESILSFIGMFLEHINGLINRIWSYDMKVVIPNIENSDLDYKFPVSVENDTDYIKDISLVSSGMKEVINLSHRIIVMQILKLDSYPIYLDEFGSRFDPVHKDKTIDIIKDLSNNFEQIFIISHHQEIFSIFNECDVSVISSYNLFMNEIKQYNNVLTIE